MSANVSALSQSGTEAVAKCSGLGSEERTHAGCALRIDPQGHRIQSGRTNKRRGRQGNLFNRPVAQQISAIHELKQFIWLEAAIMSSRTLAAAARRLFLENGAEDGIAAINKMWEKRQLELIKRKNLKWIKCQKKREKTHFFGEKGYFLVSLDTRS